MDRVFSRMGLCLIGGLIFAAGDAAPLFAQETDHPPLAVSIAVPEIREQRELGLGKDEPRFFVVIRNVSDHPVNIYGEHSSFGAYNLTLEITVIHDEALDKPLVVTRKWGMMSWMFNSPYAVTLEPGDVEVREVRVAGELTSQIEANDFTYRPFPLPAPGNEQSVRMRAVFTEKMDSRPMPGGGPNLRTPVWSGQIVSPAWDFHVTR